jgi:hypothetical protein
MKFPAKVVVTGRGTYGPFDDGRTIAYIDIADPDGGGADRATAAEGVDLDGIELFKPVTLDFELYVANGNQRKLRTFGPAGAARMQAA